MTAQDTVTKQVYVVKLTQGDPVPLKAWLAVPESHDGSTPFTVTLGFLDEDISSPLSKVAEAVVVTNGTKGAVTADGSSQRRFLIPVTPTSSQPVRIQVRGAQHCGESHAICAEEIGRVFQQGRSRWVGAADDARLRELWLVTAVGGGTTKKPAFHHDTASYLTVVDFTFSELTLHAAPYARGTTIAVTGPAGTVTVGDRWDGGKTAQLDVLVGSTTWTVTVTSDNGSQTMSYAMTVKRNPRPPPPPVYEEITVTPVTGSLVSFEKEGFRYYSATVSNDATQVDIGVNSTFLGREEYRFSHMRMSLYGVLGTRGKLTNPVDLDADFNRIIVFVKVPYQGRLIESRRSHYVAIRRLEVGQATALPEAPPETPLLADFDLIPASHDGSSTFTLRMAFSEEVEITPEDMRDHALLVSGATVTAAARVDGHKDLWES